MQQGGWQGNLPEFQMRSFKSSIEKQGTSGSTPKRKQSIKGAGRQFSGEMLAVQRDLSSNSKHSHTSWDSDACQ